MQAELRLHARRSRRRPRILPARSFAKRIPLHALTLQPSRAAMTAFHASSAYARARSARFECVSRRRSNAATTTGSRPVTPTATSGPTIGIAPSSAAATAPMERPAETADRDDSATLATFCPVSCTAPLVDAASGPIVDAASGPLVDAASGPIVDAASGPIVDAASGPIVDAASASPSGGSSCARHVDGLSILTCCLVNLMTETIVILSYVGMVLARSAYRPGLQRSSPGWTIVSLTRLPTSGRYRNS